MCILFFTIAFSYRCARVCKCLDVCVCVYKSPCYAELCIRHDFNAGHVYHCVHNFVAAVVAFAFLMSCHVFVYVSLYRRTVSVLNSVCYACLCGYFVCLILMWAWTLFLFWLHIQTSMPYYSSLLALLLLLLLLPLLFWYNVCALITIQPKIYKICSIVQRSKIAQGRAALSWSFDVEFWHKFMREYLLKRLKWNRRGPNVVHFFRLAFANVLSKSVQDLIKYRWPALIDFVLIFILNFPLWNCALCHSRRLMSCACPYLADTFRRSYRKQ